MKLRHSIPLSALAGFTSGLAIVGVICFIKRFQPCLYSDATIWELSRQGRKRKRRFVPRPRRNGEETTR